MKQLEKLLPGNTEGSKFVCVCEWLWKFGWQWHSEGHAVVKHSLLQQCVCALVGRGVTRIIHTVDIYYVNYNVTLHNFYKVNSAS